MNLQQSRYQRQLDILRKWIRVGRIGTLEAVTGFGKTFLGVLCIKHINKFYPNQRTHVVVPTVYLAQQWQQKIEEFNLKDVVVSTIQSRPVDTCKLLILDEIHRYVEVEFSKVFDSIDYQFLLGLTATLDKKDKRMHIIRSRCPVIDTVDTKEALENQWISDFQVYCLGIDAQDRTEELKQIDSVMNRFFSTFNFNFELVQACLKDPNQLRQYAKQLNWEEKIVKAHAIHYMRNLRKRKDLLYNHPAKIDVVKAIVDRFPNRKIIVFSENTDFADAIAKRIGNCGVYHSNLPSVLIDKKTNLVVGHSIKDNTGKTVYFYNGKVYGSSQLPKNVKRVAAKTYRKQIIQDFIDNKTNVLVTAKAFDEGVDIPDIDMTITVAGSSKSRQSIQRRGRALRKSKDKVAIIVELYILNSQEAKWLQSRLRHIPNVKYIVNVEEIG